MANTKYAVTLSAHGNIDHGQNPYEMLYGVSPEMGYADTIEELQQIVREYISENALGSGNWTGGEVYDASEDLKIGYISYNGRYWEATDAEGDDE